MNDKVAKQNIFVMATNIYQSCQYRTILAGTAGISHTGQQSSILIPSEMHWFKYWTVSACTGYFG
jgi:hypothetical protein